MTDVPHRPIADLHVHTTVSDGKLTLSEIPAIARDCGLSIVATTDHDRIHGGYEQPVIERDGVTVIRGIELKVELQTGDRIDLLGYAVDETAALRRMTDRIQQNRLDRGRAIIERIEDRLGISLDLPVHTGIGRPHIARAVADHPETSYTVDSVFEELIGDDGPCYVARDIPSLDAARTTLDDACAVVGVAHPFRYDNVDRALAVARKLDAVERWYPYGRAVDLARVDDAIAEADLIPTGGSDAHGRRLGLAGPDASAAERFAAACGLETAEN